MKAIKQSFIKLLFLFPMLAILIASTGIISYSINLKKEALPTSYYSVEKNNNNNIATLTTFKENTNTLLLKESEITEYLFEINYGSSFSFTNHFLKVTEKSFCFSNYKKVFVSNKNKPLYDLFCNWKLHIS